MVEQKDHASVNVMSVDDVVIVEDQDDILRDGVELVEHGCQDRFDRWRLSRLQEGDSTRANARCHGLQRGNHVSPKGRRMVIAPLERGKAGAEPGGSVVAHNDDR